jgi:3-hydroxyethyl bacteriochlorophyllide a dehydrogenase
MVWPDFPERQGHVQTLAVVFDQPGTLSVRSLALTPPGAEDVVVAVRWSGVSTGTERLLWSGRMPPFPGLGYPLVPGYESVGEVVEAGAASGRRVGEMVFVPGSRCFVEARGLFGGTAATLVVPGARVVPVDASLGERAVLMALAATAHHALEGGESLPDLVVGHGALGRLLARLVVARGGAPPTVWETDARRAGDAAGYRVCAPDDDARRDYRHACDVSGATGIVDSLVARLAPRGTVTLAGFYSEHVAFAFPPAFMREARLRVSAEWQPADLAAVARLTSDGALSLDGLVTHRARAVEARDAYTTAFGDAACVKMILDWRRAA